MGIAALTHIGGNSEPVLLKNSGTPTREMTEMFQEATRLYDVLEYGLDYDISFFQIIIGREPAYQYEELLIIALAKEKGLSYLQTGKAFGSWGKGIKSRYKFYKDYKRKSKFTRFVDKWHEILWQPKTIY